MSYIVSQDGKISITQEGMLVPSIQELYASDQGKKKTFFKEAIKYIYLFSDPYSPYINYVESDRLFNMRKEQFLYLDDNVFEELISNKHVVVALEDYKDKNYDLLLRSWEGVKIKVDNFLKHLNTLEMEIEITEKVVVDMEDGSKKPMKIKYKKSNHEEYWKALKTYNEVLKFVKAVEIDVSKEQKENKRGKSKRRLFESEKSQHTATTEIEILDE